MYGPKIWVSLLELLKGTASKFGCRSWSYRKAEAGLLVGALWLIAVSVSLDPGTVLTAPALSPFEEIIRLGRIRRTMQVFLGHVTVLLKKNWCKVGSGARLLSQEAGVSSSSTLWLILGKTSELQTPAINPLCVKTVIFTRIQDPNIEEEGTQSPVCQVGLCTTSSQQLLLLWRSKIHFLLRLRVFRASGRCGSYS